METITIQKEMKFLDSINKWVCTMFVNRGDKHSLYAAGHFHRNKETAETNAFAEIKKSLAFWQEIEKCSEHSEITIKI